MFQTAFMEPRDNRLGLPRGVNTERWATYLAHRCAREPGNLLNHVRRFYLHLARRQSDALYGALLDLSLVLGDKGSNLRGRLLRKARDLLAREHYDLFLTHYKHGLQNNQPLPPSRHSVLGNFFSGRMTLVKPPVSQKEPVRERIDPLVQAREELTYGDVETAQRILEAAVLRLPHREELHLELLELYTHTRSLDDLVRIQTQLGDDVAVARAEWERTRSMLEN
ncbi:MAG: hypothetical protein P8178_05135 [Candidatus Thiodiazotropha sp.]